ncbi:unnamed protein product [Coffea canephora]|uniref:Uncharacterized protein n=1 Tax=Coffea canephora TaxID=49390 RepID=A0A068UW13_COFCA|nr:unnamed protein product [Coffea canephora]
MAMIQRFDDVRIFFFFLNGKSHRACRGSRARCAYMAHKIHHSPNPPPFFLSVIKCREDPLLLLCLFSIEIPSDSVENWHCCECNE